MSVPDNTEVVFLVLHYLRSLDAGPQLTQATDALESALVDAHLLPAVHHFTGASRIASYEECVRHLPHIPQRYLQYALAERLPTTPVPVNTLFGTGVFNTVPLACSVPTSRNAVAPRRKSVSSSRLNPSNYSVAAYKKKFSWNLKNIHALLDQMHMFGRPMPLRNIVYSILPKQMRRLKRLVGHHQPVYCSIYDFSGDYVITGSDDHQLKVWSTRTAYLCHTLRGHEREINDIARDPSRRIIVSASRDATVRVWDLVNGENLYVLNCGGKAVNCVLFSPCPDRPYLLTGGDDGTVRLWNTRNFEQQGLAIPLPRPNRRGQTVGTTNSAHCVASTPANAVGDSFPAQSSIVAADSIPANSPPRTPSRISSPPPPHAQSNNDFQQANNLQTSHEFPVPQPPVSATLVNAQTESNALHARAEIVGTQVISNIAQGASASTGHAQAEFAAGPQIAASSANSAANNSVVSASPTVQVLSVAFNTGATRLAISGSDCMTHVYSIEKETVFGSLPTVRFLTSLRGHTGKITQVLFAHDGDRLCTASADGTARLWRRINARIPSKPRGRVVSGQGTWKNIVLDCRPSGGDVPSMSNGNGGGGAASTSITPRIPHHRFPSSVDAVLWSNRDEYVVSSSSDAKIRIWNSYTGQLVRILEAHTREVYIMDTHPFDERIILTAGYDGKCILWDIEKGVALSRFSTESRTAQGRNFDAPNGYYPNVMDGKFSPDGMSFSVTDTSGALTIFGVDSGESMVLAPEEQFFANDLVPFRWDENLRAVSQECGRLLHLLPKGDLCDSQHRRHPPAFQSQAQDLHRSLDIESNHERKMLNARAEQFRKDEDKEERRLIRAAREERKRIWREREKALLDSVYEDLPSRSMKDFVVSDSERESDDDFKVEENESEASSDDDESMDDSDAIRPERRHGRKRERPRKQRERHCARNENKHWTHKAVKRMCICKADHEVNAKMSDGGSDNSDESFRVDSDEMESDGSAEPQIRRQRDPRAHLRPSRAGATSGVGLEGNRQSSGSVRRMRIHLSRPDVDDGNDAPKDKMHVDGSVFNNEARRSPVSRSFTSERRAGSARRSGCRVDGDNSNDDIIDVVRSNQLSRASSINKQGPELSKMRSSTQWSAHSSENRGGPNSEAMVSSGGMFSSRRRSPRNRPSTRSKKNREANVNGDFDLEEFSRRELEQLKDSNKINEVSGIRTEKRSDRKRTRGKTRSSKRATERHSNCPIHGIQKSVADSAVESEDSDGSVRIRRKRRRTRLSPKRNTDCESSPKSLGSLVPYVVESANPLIASEWLRQTSEKYNYVPQRGDCIVYFPKGHNEAIEQCKKIGINALMVSEDSKLSSKPRLDASKLSDSVEPLQFIITSITFEFPVCETRENIKKRARSVNFSPAGSQLSRTIRNVAVLTLRRNQKKKWPQNVPVEVVLPYFPIDDVPEYIVLASRVEAAISSKWEPEDRFRMLFVNEKRVWQYYSGIVRRVESGYPCMGWNSVEVEYDNEDDPDKGSVDVVSPWELEAIVTSNGASTEASTSKIIQAQNHGTKPALFMAIANEISALRSSDLSWRANESWLDTVHSLGADGKYRQMIPCPIDLQVIMTRLCTAFYRHYESFLDDAELLKNNALKYNGVNSEVATVALSVYNKVVQVGERTKALFNGSGAIGIQSARARAVLERVHTGLTGNSAYLGRNYASLTSRLPSAAVLSSANGPSIPESLGPSAHIPSRGSQLAKAGSASSAINPPRNLVTNTVIAPLPPVPAIYAPNGLHARAASRPQKATTRSAQTGRVQASPDSRMRLTGVLSGNTLPIIQPNLSVGHPGQISSAHSLMLPQPSTLQPNHVQSLPSAHSQYNMAPGTIASRSFPLNHFVSRATPGPQRGSVGMSNSLANLLSPPVVSVNGNGFMSTSDVPNIHPVTTVVRRGLGHDGGTVSCGGSIEAAGGQNGPFSGHATTSESRVQTWPIVPNHSNNSPVPVPRVDGGPPTSAALDRLASSGNVASSAIQFQESSRHEHSSISVAAAESTISCGGENANVGESTEIRRER